MKINIPNIEAMMNEINSEYLGNILDYFFRNFT